jgi:ribonuclease BN (tRNA processing enzyme)
VASVAKKAGVSRLGLIHINPSYDERRCEAMLDASRRILTNTIIPVEGKVLAL